MVMGSEEIIPNGVFYKSGNAIVDSHIKELCADVSSFNDLSLCSFVDYASNETMIQNTMHLIMRHVKNAGISDQWKKDVCLHLGKGVTLSMGLTRDSARVNA